MNFQESMTILNACTKKSGNLLKAPRKNNLVLLPLAWIIDLSLLLDVHLFFFINSK